MSGLSPAERLFRVNVVLIAVLGVLFVVCVVRSLWFPAAAFAALIFSNAMQIALRRRDG